MYTAPISGRCRAAAIRAWLVAISSWGEAAVSDSSIMVKPPVVPRPGSGGGLKGMMIAPGRPATLRANAPITLVTCRSLEVRSAQGRNRATMNAVLEATVPEMMSKPTTEMVDSTAGISRRVAVTSSAIRVVRSWAAASGSVTCARK